MNILDEREILITNVRGKGALYTLELGGNKLNFYDKSELMKRVIQKIDMDEYDLIALLYYLNKVVKNRENI